eukprot:428747-Pyramimonas_sp.AAC.1
MQIHMGGASYAAQANYSVQAVECNTCGAANAIPSGAAFAAQAMWCSLYGANSLLKVMVRNVVVQYIPYA